MKAWAFIVHNSLLLVAGAVSALMWANVDLASYEQFAHGPIHFATNDIGMALFFALAAKQIIEARLPGGPLASPREAAVPVIAAVGGMAGPALIYVALASALGRPELYRGWAVPCATDIAFSYMAARLIFPPRHPGIPFLLLLAIADDALGLILLAVFYPTGPLSILTFAALMVPAIGLSYALKKFRHDQLLAVPRRRRGTVLVRHVFWRHPSGARSCADHAADAARKARSWASSRP